MNNNNPYKNLAPNAFWKTGVTESNPARLEGLYSKKFPLQSTDIIVAAGSCFAQRISQHLKLHGYQVADYEPCPPSIPPEKAIEHGYELYSARYGNIYTVHQLLQLAREAAGILRPSDIIWQNDNRFYDALRPNIQPGGFDSASAVNAAREAHLRSVRKMLCEMDVFIYTMGLTESWRHKHSGTVYPVAPGIIAGHFDDEQHEFVNFSFSETKEAFREFVAVVTALRGESAAELKMVLTVSPVPLTATASGAHVLRATTYSKSVLRTVAEELWRENAYIDYFPSYEIITNQKAAGSFYQDNGRSITDAGVKAVMDVFFAEHANPDNSATENPPASEDEHCEEVLLDAFAPEFERRQSAERPILFFGNSHLAAVKKCLSDTTLWDDNFASSLNKDAYYLASNWLDSPWENISEHDYLQSPIIKSESIDLCTLPPQHGPERSTTLVMVGLKVMGDGILRAFGDLQAGNSNTVDGRLITPALPLLENGHSIHVRKRFEKFYLMQFLALRDLVQAGRYQNIYIIESPDMIEDAARFRMGDEFVESGSYRCYKYIARKVVNKYAQALDIKLIRHPESLLGEYGFSLNRYASTEKSYDIHVSREYYVPALTTLWECFERREPSGRNPDSSDSANLKRNKLGALASDLASTIGFRRKL